MSPDLLVVVCPVVVGAGGPVVAIGQTVPVPVSAPVAGATAVSLPAGRSAGHCLLYYNTALRLCSTNTVKPVCPVPAPGVSEARQLVPAPRPGGGSHRLLAGGPLGEVQVQASSITYGCWQLTWRAEDLERRPSSTRDWREARRSVDSDLDYGFIAYE